MGSWETYGGCKASQGDLFVRQREVMEGRVSDLKMNLGQQIQGYRCLTNPLSTVWQNLVKARVLGGGFKLLVYEYVEAFQGC